MKPRPLTEHQFATLGVLARRPDEYRIAWAGCGGAAFGFGEDPSDRQKCRDLILSVPKRYRWPCTNTIKSLRQRGLIRVVGKTPYFFYTIFEITQEGLDAYKADPAYDGPPDEEAMSDMENDFVAELSDAVQDAILDCEGYPTEDALRHQLGKYGLKIIKAPEFPDKCPICGQDSAMAHCSMGGCPVGGDL